MEDRISMATKRQVTLRFRDEYMKASKKDKGRILDEMCSVLAIGRSTARRRLAEAGRGPVSFQPSFLSEGTPSFRAVVNHSGRFWFSMYRFNVSNGAPPLVPA